MNDFNFFGIQKGNTHIHAQANVCVHIHTEFCLFHVQEGTHTQLEIKNKNEEERRTCSLVGYCFPHLEVKRIDEKEIRPHFLAGYC